MRCVVSLLRKAWYGARKHKVGRRPARLPSSAEPQHAYLGAWRFFLGEEACFLQEEKEEEEASRTLVSFCWHHALPLSSSTKY